MTITYLLDNTVLCNFAAVHRLDLLRRFLDGRGCWVEAVAYEAEKSARYLPDLAVIATEGWLGEQIVFDDPLVVERIEQVRRAVFGGHGREPTRHLGEAQTFHLLKTMPEYAGAYWLTDDTEAVRLAERQQIIVRDTPELLELLVRDELVTARDAYALIVAMVDADRGVRLPSGADQLSRQI